MSTSFVGLAAIQFVKIIAFRFHKQEKSERIVLKHLHG